MFFWAEQSNHGVWHNYDSTVCVPLTHLSVTSPPLNTICRVVCFVHFISMKCQENTVTKTNNEFIDIHSKHINRILDLHVSASGREISTSQKKNEQEVMHSGQ